MTALGAPLAVYTAIDYCNTTREHEVRLVTDGFRGYAYGTRYGATDCPGITRTDANLITVSCGQPVEEGECLGEVTFTGLSTGDWISVSTEEGAEALDLLTKYGERVES